MNNNKQQTWDKVYEKVLQKTGDKDQAEQTASRAAAHVRRGGFNINLGEILLAAANVKAQEIYQQKYGSDCEIEPQKQSVVSSAKRKVRLALNRRAKKRNKIQKQKSRRK